VVVKGYTDSAGNAAADVTLSQMRAQAVADALKSDGVAAGRISIRGRGQTHEEPGQASRRVEIDVGG
jgi:outer membrane protein OmpA-like peptidoglycan-associated protein